MAICQVQGSTSFPEAKLGLSTSELCVSLEPRRAFLLDPDTGAGSDFLARSELFLLEVLVG